MLPVNTTTADQEWQNIESCRQSGDVEQSIAMLLAYVHRNPQHAQAHCQLAELFSDKGDFALAEQAYRNVLLLISKHSPEYTDVLNNWGLALLKIRRLPEALAVFDEILRRNPQFEAAHVNRGTTLLELERYEVSRALTLFQLERLPEALAAFDEALRLNPQLETAHNSRGLILVQLNRLFEALATFDEALKLNPQSKKARRNRGQILLKLGRYEEGWHDYESRLLDYPDLVPHVPFPYWQGEPLAKRSILVLAEQGFGDQIQFVRYLHKLLALGGLVDVLVKPTLLRLIQRFSGVINVFDDIKKTPKNYDFQIPLLSLPRIFGTTVSTIPSAVPYIPLLTHCHQASEDELRRQWQQRVDEAMAKNTILPKLKIGLVWAGGHRPNDHAAMAVDQRRSLQFSWIKPLVTIPYIQFFSLQYGSNYTAEIEAFNQDLRTRVLPNVSPIIDLTGYIEDFSDTAALIEHLDLVIACDTSVAHLAGALGIPVWIMNRYDQCWRWLQNRSDSPWYPTVKLFQQPSPGDWESVVQNISQELRNLV